MDEEDREHFVRMNMLFLIGMTLIAIIGVQYTLVFIFKFGLIGIFPLSVTFLLELMFYQLKGMYKLPKTEIKS